jgi:hypothetical protein
MSLLDLNLADVEDLHAVSDGEYLLTLINCEIALSKSGNEQIIATLRIDKDPNSKDIKYYMGLPLDSDDEKQSSDKKRRIKKFMDRLKIDYTADLKSGIGHQAWALLEAQDDEQWGPQNRIRRFI